MRRSMLVFLFACSVIEWAGCSKEAKPPEEVHRAPSNDGLWALAPAGTEVGVVVAGGTGDSLLAAWAELERSLAGAPGHTGIMRAGLAKIRGALPPQVLDAEAHEEMGLDLGLGAALFVTQSGAMVMVLPVVDRAAFVTATGGTSQTPDGGDRIENAVCKEIASHYVCASNDALLGQVGESDALARRAAQRPAHLRGQVEVRIEGRALVEAEASMASIFAEVPGLDAALRLERGAFTVRAHLDASLSPMLTAFAQVPSNLAVAAMNPTGITRLRVPLARLLPPDAMAALAPVAAMGNIDIQRDLIENIVGEVVAYAPGGRDMQLVIELGARDGERLRPLIAALCAMGRGAMPMLEVAAQGERCTATLDPASLGAPAAQELLQGPISAELYAEANVIGLALDLANAGQADPAQSTAAELTPVGRTLVSGAWSWASWYQGNVLAGHRPAMLGSLPSPGDAEVAKTMLWAAAHLAELGLGVGIREDGVHVMVHLGTQWANPDDVVRAYQDALAALLDGDAGAAARLRALAASAPETTLGRSYQAGMGGMVAGSAGLGMLAAIAVPSFTRYTKKAKTIEARESLQKMYDGARMFYRDPPADPQGVVVSRFPSPSVGPTPPLGTCCAQGGECAPDAALWDHPTWRELLFSADDPHYYSYEYELIDETREFVLRAYGDLDCDGELSTFELRGTIEEGADGLAGRPELRVVNELE